MGLGPFCSLQPSVLKEFQSIGKLFPLQLGRTWLRKEVNFHLREVGILSKMSGFHFWVMDVGRAAAHAVWTVGSREGLAVPGRGQAPTARALKTASASLLSCPLAVRAPWGGGGAGGRTPEVHGRPVPLLGPMGLGLPRTWFMEGMCLQFQIPTEKDKGDRWGEIPGPHFSCCSCGLKPLNLARLPREGVYKAHCPLLSLTPAPLLPPALSVFLSFLSHPQEKCSMGKSRRPQHGLPLPAPDRGQNPITMPIFLLGKLRHRAAQ